MGAAPAYNRGMRRSWRRYGTMAALALPLGGARAIDQERTVGLAITSTAFEEGAEIPRQHTCDGADVSPPLAWTGVPEGTAAVALIMDDPDAPAGTWVHWVLYDVAPSVTALAENVSKTEHPKELAGAAQGKSSFKRLGYGGPCPPPGPTHRYFFKLYALAGRVDLPPGASKQDLERAMGGHILATAQIMGRYQRAAR